MVEFGGWHKLYEERIFVHAIFGVTPSKNETEAPDVIDCRRDLMMVYSFRWTQVLCNEATCNEKHVTII